MTGPGKLPLSPAVAQRVTIRRTRRTAVLDKHAGEQP